MSIIHNLHKASMEPISFTQEKHIQNIQSANRNSIHMIVKSLLMEEMSHNKNFGLELIDFLQVEGKKFTNQGVLDSSGQKIGEFVDYEIAEQIVFNKNDLNKFLNESKFLPVIQKIEEKIESIKFKKINGQSIEDIIFEAEKNILGKRLTQLRKLLGEKEFLDFKKDPESFNEDNDLKEKIESINSFYASLEEKIKQNRDLFLTRLYLEGKDFTKESFQKNIDVYHSSLNIYNQEIIHAFDSKGVSLENISTTNIKGMLLNGLGYAGLAMLAVSAVSNPVSAGILASKLYSKVLPEDFKNKISNFATENYKSISGFIKEKVPFIGKILNNGEKIVNSCLKKKDVIARENPKIFAAVSTIAIVSATIMGANLHTDGAILEKAGSVLEDSKEFLSKHTESLTDFGKETLISASSLEVSSWDANFSIDETDLSQEERHPHTITPESGGVPFDSEFEVSDSEIEDIRLYEVSVEQEETLKTIENIESSVGEEKQNIISEFKEKQSELLKDAYTGSNEGVLSKVQNINASLIELTNTEIEIGGNINNETEALKEFLSNHPLVGELNNNQLYNLVNEYNDFVSNIGHLPSGGAVYQPLLETNLVHEGDTLSFKALNEYLVFQSVADAKGVAVIDLAKESILKELASGETMSEELKNFAEGKSVYPELDLSSGSKTLSVGDTAIGIEDKYIAQTFGDNSDNIKELISQLEKSKVIGFEPLSSDLRVGDNYDIRASKLIELGINSNLSKEEISIAVNEIAKAQGTEFEHIASSLQSDASSVASHSSDFESIERKSRLSGKIRLGKDYDSPSLFD